MAQKHGNDPAEQRRAQEVGASLRSHRKKIGWTIKKTATLAEVDPGFLSRLETGKSGYSHESLTRVAGAMGLPLDRLYRSGSNVEPAPLDHRRIPVLDYVQAGKWRAVQEMSTDAEMSEFIMVNLEHPPSSFGLRIKGDSMEPEFKEGDIVVIAPSISPRPGDFVVARDAVGEATFKQFRAAGLNDRGQDVFELTPLNLIYPVLRSDRQELAIVGTMVEHRRYRRR